MERRFRTLELAFPDASSSTAGVLRRFEGAIERTLGVAAGPALVTLGNPEKTGRYDVWSSEKIWDLYLYGAINSSI
jgi:hypothetical protein